MYQIKEPDDIKSCDYWTRRFLRGWGRIAGEDEIQIGRLAMCKAATRYDETKGKFWGFVPIIIHRSLVRSLMPYDSQGNTNSKCVFRQEDKPLNLVDKKYDSYDEESTAWVDLYTNPYEQPEATAEELTIQRDLINKELKTMYPKVAKALVDKAVFGIDYEETAKKMRLQPRSMIVMIDQWRRNFRNYARLTTKARQKKFWNGYEVDLYKLAAEEIEGADAK